MKRKLVYCPRIAGHRLEYIHHIYQGVRNSRDYFIFVVPSEFENQKDKLEWDLYDNVTFVTLDNKFKTSSNISKIKQSICNSKALAYYAKQYKVDDVVVLDLMEYVPFLPYYVPSKIKVKGIIYKIITYEWKYEGFLRRKLDYLKYWVMAKFKVYDSVYMLNDINAPIELNKKFKTSHFKFLPDPVVPINSVEDIDIRTKYKISCHKKIILHPGGMLPYKGTLEILKALAVIPKEYHDEYAFIFAGRVTKSIKDEFYKLLKNIDEKLQVIIEDDFFTFERLGAFFKSADWILIPYKTRSQSSGIVGHAAFFKKPVIAVKGGLIGSIVEAYNLGVLIDDSTYTSISDVLVKLPNWNYVANKYVESHKIEDFTRIILC